MKRRWCVRGVLGLWVMLCLSAAGSSAWAQAWTQSQGQVYLKTSYGLVLASEQFSFDGQIKPYAEGVEGNAFVDQSAVLYAEGGITKFLTLYLTLPYKFTSIQDTSFQYYTRAFGNGLLGARLGWKELLGLQWSRSSLATNIALVMPLGYTRNYKPSVGPGQMDIEVSMNYGLSFYPLPIYAQIGVGYRHRSSVFAFSQLKNCQSSDIDCIPVQPGTPPPDFGDEFFFSVDAGYSFQKWALLQVILMGTISLTAPDTGFSVSNPIPTLQRFIKGGGALTVFPLAAFAWGKTLGVNVQAMYTLYGQNTIRSFDLFVGLSYTIAFNK